MPDPAAVQCCAACPGKSCDFFWHALSAERVAKLLPCSPDAFLGWMSRNRLPDRVTDLATIERLVAILDESPADR
jgi:hypothetical protein